jgi:hypothetical protein
LTGLGTGFYLASHEQQGSPLLWPSPSAPWLGYDLRVPSHPSGVLN